MDSVTIGSVRRWQPSDASMAFAIECSACKGERRLVCPVCHGTKIDTRPRDPRWEDLRIALGMPEHSKCTACSNDGMVKCHPCEGTGRRDTRFGGGVLAPGERVIRGRRSVSTKINKRGEEEQYETFVEDPYGPHHMIRRN
jgi:hypothetical protein